MWQDWVLAIGDAFFIISLMFSVLDKDAKPHRITSLINTTILAIFCVTFYSLGLIVTTVTTSVLTALWATLFLQKSYG